MELDTLEISISDLKFVPRKPPDASAKFDEKFKHFNTLILDDVVRILSVLRRKVYITVAFKQSDNVGGYAQTLSENLAKLIASSLKAKGVPKDQLLPRTAAESEPRIILTPCSPQYVDVESSRSPSPPQSA